MRAVRKSYLSDITDEQWELLKGFIPAAKPGGRPRKVDPREIVNSILLESREAIKPRPSLLDRSV